MSEKQIVLLYVFESSSSPGVTYQTLVYKDGTMSCDCKAWRFMKRSAAGQRTCVHTRKIEAGIADCDCKSKKDYRNGSAKLPIVEVKQDPQDALNFTPVRRFDFGL